MNRLAVLVLAVLAVVFVSASTQVAVAPESNTLPILPTPDFSALTAYPVVRVVDGDTIVVSIKGKDVKVRLVGVDTPETVHPAKPVEHYGKEASRFTTNLLKGEKVYLIGEPLPGALDRYGRTLAYVYRAPDGPFVNAEIIRQGYGHAYTQIPSKYMQEFKQLERFARKAEKGLWAPIQPVPKLKRKTKSWEIIAIKTKITEQNPVYWKFAWRLTVKNNLERTINLSGEIEFQDAEGFVVDTDSLYNIIVPANSSTTFTGAAMVTTSIAPKVAATVVKLHESLF